jgi:hypothetical protein
MMITTHQAWDWGMPKPRGGNRHAEHRQPQLHVVDVAIQGLVHSKDKFRHAANLLPELFKNSLSLAAREMQVECNLCAAMPVRSFTRGLLLGRLTAEN